MKVKSLQKQGAAFYIHTVLILPLPHNSNPINSKNFYMGFSTQHLT